MEREAVLWPTGLGGSVALSSTVPEGVTNTIPVSTDRLGIGIGQECGLEAERIKVAANSCDVMTLKPLL